MLIIFSAVLVFTVGRCTDNQSFAKRTVRVGEDVTLTCSRRSTLAGYLFWIRLVVGNLPEVLAATYTFNNANIIETPRYTAKQEPDTFVLHIIKTERSDTAFYYCEQVLELQTTFLNKTLLRVKGPEPDITAVVQHSPSDPARPGDSVTLQCSVLSDSKSKTCLEEHSVYWFRAGSNESHPSIIYACGNSGDGCEKSLEARSSQKCVYSFSKNVSSSDAGTHYCAVAMCGHIFFGNGTKLDVEGANTCSYGDSQRANTILFLLCPALALNLIVIASLIYIIRNKKCNCCNAAAALQTNAATSTGEQQSQQTDEDSLVYYVPKFNRRKAGRSVKRDALISVTTVQLGEAVTFTYSFPDLEYSNTRVKWYKQSIGDTLTLITTLMKATADPTFEQGFPPSRFHANYSTTVSTLTILKTIEEDEALYHCTVTSWSKDQWSGTYLSLKGNTQRTTDYTVVQWPSASGPFHPGDSVSLQCSVLPDSETKSCPGEHSVHWFGVRSDKSHPNIIYTGGNIGDECDKKPDAHSPPKSCVYHFSKDVSSSDAGTYYCAVATCGEIIFGNGTKLDIEGTSLRSLLQTDNIILPLLCAVMAISVIVIAFLIHAIKKKKCDYCNKEAAVSLHENVAKRNLKGDEDAWIYSAAVFTVMKTGSDGMSDAKAVDRRRIYAAVKAFGLD